MKRWLRILTIVLILATVLSLGASALDFSYREFRPDMDIPMPPQWSQTAIKITSGDDILQGYLTRPAHTTEKVPVAILLHGLNTDQRWCEDIAFKLADNGIASVRFNFAGTGSDSTRAQQDMTLSTQVRDVCAALDYAEALSYVDTDHIFLVGKSMGGVDAMITAMGRGDEIAGICLWYPGFGATASLRAGFMMGSFFNPNDPPETVQVLDYTYGRDFIREVQSLDMEAVLSGYQGPVYIIHGDYDFIAPIQFSFWAKRIIADCQLQVIPAGFHGFLGYQELVALDSMTEFFTEILND